MNDEPRSAKWSLPGALLLAVCLGGAEAAAQEIYRTVDENGVVSFSDVATEDAVRLELPATVVSEDALTELEARIALQLEVAKALETSRLAREAARTERLEALADAESRTIYYREEDQDRYEQGDWTYWGSGYWNGGYPGGGWGGGWPGHRPGHPPGGRPPHPEHPLEPPVPQDPPSRRVPLPPLKSN